MDKDLALRIQTYIARNAPVLYSTLEAKALAKSITLEAFGQAMEIIHRRKFISRKVKGEDIEYAMVTTTEKPKEDMFMRFDDYPAMDSTNNAHHEIFAGISYAHLFLTPEDMLKFKAELKGMTYIPRKRYEHTRRQNTARHTQALA